MVDLALFSGILGAGIIYWISGKYLEPNKPVPKQVRPDIVPVFERKAIISPFTDVHFVELDGKLRPRLSTIATLVDKLDFKLVEPPYINARYTGWTVECQFKNILEVEYEGAFPTLGWLKQTYPKGLFNEDERKHPDFFKLLELKLKIDLWNYYCNKFPEALQHNAVLGANLLENEHLR